MIRTKAKRAPAMWSSPYATCVNIIREMPRPHRPQRAGALRRGQGAPGPLRIDSAWAPNRQAGPCLISPPEASATKPADPRLMMQLGAEAIFVGSGIFMKERATPLDVENDPKEREEAVSRAKAIVIATTTYNDPRFSPRSPSRSPEP